MTGSPPCCEVFPAPIDYHHFLAESRSYPLGLFIVASMHRRVLPKSRKSPNQAEIERWGEKLQRSLRDSKQMVLVLLCLASILGLNLIFSIWNPGLFWLLPASLPFTAILGAGLYSLSDLLWRLQVRMTDTIGRIYAVFLLFFLFLLTMVILYFLLLVWPVGFLLKNFADGSLALDYQRWSLDLAVVQSLVFWTWSVSRKV
jgi:cellulose synthase/poly-beta-1,6-N-acetylglucosamine synthase-like glycosyltransferase